MNCNNMLICFLLISSNPKYKKIFILIILLISSSPVDNKCDEQKGYLYVNA